MTRFPHGNNAGASAMPIPEGLIQGRNIAGKNWLSMATLMLVLAACAFSSGCDFGTYSKRLNEKPVAPVVETDADEGETDSDAAPDDGGDADRDEER